MPGEIFLRNENIELRTVEREDIEFLQEKANYPEVRKWIGRRRPINRMVEEDFFENVVCGDENHHLAVCRDGEIKGIISLYVKDEVVRKAEIGISLHPEFHGKGLGTEASRLITGFGFNELNMERIYVRVYGPNQKSARVWEKLGYTHEGAMRSHEYVDGEYVDVDIYGVLREEWE